MLTKEIPGCDGLPIFDPAVEDGRLDFIRPHANHFDFLPRLQSSRNFLEIGRVKGMNAFVRTTGRSEITREWSDPSRSPADLLLELSSGRRRWILARLQLAGTEFEQKSSDGDPAHSHQENRAVGILGDHGDRPRMFDEVLPNRLSASVRIVDSTNLEDRPLVHQTPGRLASTGTIRVISFA